MKTDNSVRKVGENIVAQWLSEKGYVTNVGSNSSIDIAIEAKGPVKSLVILVTPMVQCKESVFPSYEELKKVKFHAAKLECDPYEAIVPLDENFKLTGQIQFRRL